MRNIWKIMGSGVLVCLLFAAPAVAQLAANTVDFTTDFPFYAGNMKLPAGSYSVSQSDAGQDLILIQNKSRSHEGFVDSTPTQAEQPHAKTEVTFNRYGTTEYLNLIWIGGQVTGVQVSPSKSEQKLASASAAQKHSVSGKAH